MESYFSVLQLTENFRPVLYENEHELIIALDVSIYFGSGWS